MSALYQIRTEIKTLLMADGLWADGEVIIKRRSELWNTVATAVAASEAGQCIVVGVAKGTPDRSQRVGSRQLLMEISVPITLIESANLSPDDTESPDGTDEDTRWEGTVMRLLGSPLGRSAEHYEMSFDGFEDIADDEYVIRQTTFKTKLLLKP